jgi:hypothetical protein
MLTRLGHSSKFAPCSTQLCHARTYREFGWAGVAFSPSQPGTLATARAMAKDITLYDGPTGRAACSFGTLLQPHSLTFLAPTASTGGGPLGLLAVTEGHTVSHSRQ